MPKQYKCPYCDYKNIKEKLIDHIESEHEDMIPENYSGARIVFNLINKKDHGSCVVCKKETNWNEDAYRYDRLCNNPKCRESLRQEYKKNMIKVYNKVTLLDDPEHQQYMLANRRISGKYKFQDGVNHTYTGSYEKKALEFMDKVMNIKSSDIMCPGPKLEYEYEGKKHIWITDIYYIPLNLIIEVKDGGSNPNNREMTSYREKQIAKETMITKLGTFNYLRLTNNNFSQLLYIVAELKMKMLDNDDSKSININETSQPVAAAIPSPNASDSVYIVNKLQGNIMTSKCTKDKDILDEVIDKGNSKEIAKYNIYKVKDEAVLSKEILSADQLEYDSMVEEVNFNKIASAKNIAKLSLMQEISLLKNKTLPYLPVMNPNDICVKKELLDGYDYLDILEDENGYFLYDKVTGLRDKSYKSIHEISIEDSALRDREAERWVRASGSSMIRSNYKDEDKLSNDWYNYNNMSDSQKHASDEKSLELYGKTNTQRYYELKNKLSRLDIEDDKLGADKDSISSVHEEDTLEDKYNFDNVTYTDADTEKAITWSKESLRTIIYPTNSLEELELLWNEFKLMHRQLQRESDWKSEEIFGMNNETHYIYLKNKWSRRNIEKPSIDLGDDSISSSTSEVPEYKELSYFCPREMKDLGVFKTITGGSRSNRYSDTPFISSNEAMRWFNMYELIYDNPYLGVTEEYNKMNIKRLETIKELYHHLSKGVRVDDIKQSILELGWNPELDFSYNTRIKVDKRVNSMMNENSNKFTFIDMSNMPITEESISSNSDVRVAPFYRPVYIVFTESKSLFGKAIKKFGFGDISHVAVAFDEKLEHMYSFSSENNGFGIEKLSNCVHVTNLKVFCIFVDNIKYNKLKSTIDNFIRNADKTTYNYTGVINIALHRFFKRFRISYSNKMNMTMFCSQFVDSLFKSAGININTNKKSTNTSPHDFYNSVDYKKNIIYKLYDGTREAYKYLSIRNLINRIANKIEMYKEEFLNDSEYTFVITETKDFPVQFDVSGNLLISSSKNIDNINFEEEYNFSHKLLLIYSKNKQYEAMKGELCKLWFLNNIIERRIYSKNHKDLYKVRARILNDFNKYLQEVIENDKSFDFTEYYSHSPYNDNTIRIRSSTLKYTAKYIKDLIKL